MDEPRHLIIEAVFYAEKINPPEDYDPCCDGQDENDDPDTFEPPCSCPPLHWLYGKEDCELIGLPPGEWHEPFFDEMIERWAYQVQECVYDIPEEAWQRFAERYDYLPEQSEPNMGMLGIWPDGVGLRPGWRWNDDGSDFNSGGWTPVAYTCLSLTATVGEVENDPGHFGFVVIERN